MNHFYQNIQGYFTWTEFYARLALEMKVKDVPTFGVELGTCNGTSLAYLAVELINIGATCVVDGVDTSNANGHAAKNLAPVMGTVVGKLHSCKSWEAAALYPDASLDFVFIDADHAYESVKQDVIAWRPKVKPLGIMAGHDYSQDFAGVMLAVAEEFETWTVHRGDRYPGAAELTPVGRQYFPVWSVRL